MNWCVRQVAGDRVNTTELVAGSHRWHGPGVGAFGRIAGRTSIEVVLAAVLDLVDEQRASFGHDFNADAIMRGRGA